MYIYTHSHIYVHTHKEHLGRARRTNLDGLHTFGFMLPSHSPQHTHTYIHICNLYSHLYTHTKSTLGQSQEEKS